MFLPIGDLPRPRATPSVTYALVAVNVVAFLLVTVPLQNQAVNRADPLLTEYLQVMAQQSGASVRAVLRGMSEYDLFIFRHGFKPAASSVADLFASLFLHSGWVHLLSNMLFLWIFGANVEHRMGRWRFLILYLATGAVATLFFGLFRPLSLVPLIGASGAISGVLGAYFVWFGQNRVRVLLVLFVFMDVLLVPARWVLGFYILIDNILPFLLGGTSGVAYGAHIGGFFGGAAAAWLLDRWIDRPQISAPSATSDLPESGIIHGTSSAHAVLDVFHLAVAQKNHEVALSAYAQMGIAERQLLADEDLLELADYLADTRRHDLALAVLQRLISTRPNSPALARAHLRAGLIQLYARGQLASAREHLLTVLDLDAHGLLAEAARQALADVDSRQV